MTIEPISDERLAEIRAGLEKLPKGPWRKESHDLGGGVQITAADGGPVFRAYGNAFSTQGWSRDGKTATIAANYALAVQPDFMLALLARLDKAEAALRFYADHARYMGSNNRADGDDPYAPEPGFPYLWDVNRDGGKIARDALPPNPTA